jgi:hypothetical protein
MRVGIIGNCQSSHLARCLKVVNPSLDVSNQFDVDGLTGEELIRIAEQSDILLAQLNSQNAISHLPPHLQKKCQFYPAIAFDAFHPDLTYLTNNGTIVSGPLHHYHSTLGLALFTKGFTPREATQFFNTDVFERLGYLNKGPSARAALLHEGQQADLPLADLLPKWERLGCFMHTINHPKLAVISDLSVALAKRIGVEIIVGDTDRFLSDDLQAGAVWPVYPGVAEQFGLLGDYSFKAPHDQWNLHHPFELFGLTQFLEKSFSLYSTLPNEKWATLQNFTEYCSKLDEIIAFKRGSKSRAKQPYSDLPKYQFWRSGVTSVESGSVDPFVPQKDFRRFTVNDKVATAGSCFAQHIGNAISKQGLNLLNVEPAPDEMTDDAAAASNYGIFSGRYGNIYTARQLRQLFERSAGIYTPSESAWQRSDGAFVDPFRPHIEPNGFLSIEALERDRIKHLAAVYKMFCALDVLIFTLGLTEGWRSKCDGAIFPLAPGVSGGEWDSEKYEFVNFGTDEVIEDLYKFVELLREVNPKARIILTVSPVPLIATYERSHVLSATFYSKSVLRVAAETLARLRTDVTYFPSYEIIVGPHARGRYYDNDLRTILPIGVEHVMSVFGKHFLPRELGFNREERVNRSLFRIVCDEESIQASLDPRDS